jgi:hypothetical protein
MNDYGELDRKRRALLRRATFYTYAFLSAGLIVAVGGSALVALLLSRGGLPFRETWLVITAIVLVPSLLGLVVRAVREHGRTVRSARSTEDDDKEQWPKTKH